MKYVILLCGIVFSVEALVEAQEKLGHLISLLEKYRPDNQDGSQPKDWMTTLKQISDVKVTVLKGQYEEDFRLILKCTDSANEKTELREFLLQLAHADRKNSRKYSILQRFIECCCPKRSTVGNLSSLESAENIPSRAIRLTNQEEIKGNGCNEYTYEIIVPRTMTVPTSIPVPDGSAATDQMDFQKLVEDLNADDSENDWEIISQDA